ncbi:MAG: hypothetical protein GX096_09340 [Clostridiales bacterium]|nr:hypothetical protein [Clostridiales bacterium]
MRKTILSYVLAICILLTLCIPALSEEASSALPTQVYVYALYYHKYPNCPIANEWEVPLKPVEITGLSDASFKLLRPCMLCLPLENEAYYVDNSDLYTEKEMEEKKGQDYIAMRLLNRDDFTFEDWAELRPGSYGIPDENDISREEAIRIAAEKVASEYSIDLEVALNLKSNVTCWPDKEYNGVDNLKTYLVQFIDLDHPFFYNVELITSTGEVIDTLQFKNLKYNETAVH